MKSVITKTLYVIVSVTIGLGLWVGSYYYDQNQEEKEYRHLEAIADTYYEQRFLIPMIRGMEDLYRKNNNDTIAIYKAENRISTYSFKQYEKSGKKIDKYYYIPKNEYFIMFKEKDYYKIYTKVYANNKVDYESFSLTFEEDIAQAKLNKAADLNNMRQMTADFYGMIKEIKANEKNPKAPPAIRTVNQTLNLLQYGDIDGPRKVVEAEPNPLMELINGAGSIIEFIFDYGKWIMIIVILSALVNAVSGGGSGSSHTADDFEDDEPQQQNDQGAAEKEKRPKTAGKPAEDGRQKQKRKEPAEEKSGPKNNTRVGMVNLHIDDVANMMNRDTEILFKNGRYFINTGFGNSDLWADSADEIRVKAIGYFSKRDGVKKVNVELY